MSDHDKSAGADEQPNLTGFTPGPASKAVVSLSQAILAPLDALAKAQVHAARSFLNFVLQIGYPHAAASKDDTERVKKESSSGYSLPFAFDQTVIGDNGQQETRRVVLSLPALALVPIHPLRIRKATFDLELHVREIGRHRQIQKSEEDEVNRETATDGESDADAAFGPRPWYLVPEPISVRGTLAGSVSSERETQQPLVKVHVEVEEGPVPVGLSRLITSLGQVSDVSERLPPTTR